MTASRTLKVAVFGAGRMGRHHVQAIMLAPDAELVAVCDPVADSADIAAVAGTEVPLFRDPEVLFSSVCPDVVHIVTPPATHVPLAEMALENGAHVYTEKPFAECSQDARRVLALAAEKGLKVCAAHQVLFQDAGRAYRERRNEIGDIVHVESYFSFNSVRRDVHGAKQGIHEQLLDILPHPVYLLLSALEAQPGVPHLDHVWVAPEGEVRAQISQGSAVGQLIVSLNARPVESYLHVVGRNGALHADFVLSGLTALPGPGADAVSALLQPYRTALQLVWHTTAGLARRVFRRQKSYVGLSELIEAFYASVRGDAELPVSPEEILNTVGICEKIAEQLTLAQQNAAVAGTQRLMKRELAIPRLPDGALRVAVTGAAGFLGQEVVRRLRASGRYVRAITRSELNVDRRQAGVDYRVADLAETLPSDLLEDIDAVVHLAAETAGDKALHQRNTVHATANLASAAAAAGIDAFINSSSIAVHVQGETPVKETSPVVADESRGPYVWAKARAEAELQEVFAPTSVCFRNFRLGPLVDEASFSPPGRLGREVGPFFVAPGSGGDTISLCSVQQVAEVIDYALDHLDQLPTHINLVDPESPTRRQLLNRLKDSRPYLFLLRVPGPLLTLLSGTATMIQKYLLRKDKVLDIASAFHAQQYDSTVAAGVLQEARRWQQLREKDECTQTEISLEEQDMKAAVEVGR